MEKGQQWEMDLYERAVALMGEETVYIHVINRMAMLCRAMVDCMDGKKNRSEKCMKRVAERRASMEIAMNLLTVPLGDVSEEEMQNLEDLEDMVYACED